MIHGVSAKRETRAYTPIMFSFSICMAAPREDVAPIVPAMGTANCSRGDLRTDVELTIQAARAERVPGTIKKQTSTSKIKARAIACANSPR